MKKLNAWLTQYALRGLLGRVDADCFEAGYRTKRH
jgi:hypothetical protein